MKLKRLNSAQFVIRLTSVLNAVFLLMQTSVLYGSATFEKGGLAEAPAVETYADWMQFSSPSDHTPAIDQDGCLNYALAKLAVRYNLPVEGCSVFQDSYTFYDTFVNTVISNGPTKSQSFATYFSDYVTFAEQVMIGGAMEESFQAAYDYCVSTDITPQHAYVLKLVTGSGSDHYVLVDQVDTEHQYLSLLDSGSWYIDYLGDEKSREKGYCVTQIYTFSFSQVPGDFDQDFRLTHADAESCIQQLTTETWEEESLVLQGDADGNGIVDLSDAIYIAKFAEASGTESEAFCTANKWGSDAQSDRDLNIDEISSDQQSIDSLPNDVIPFVRQMTEQTLQASPSK